MIKIHSKVIAAAVRFMAEMMAGDSGEDSINPDEGERQVKVDPHLGDFSLGGEGGFNLRWQ
jgi:hypothetical protein